jgi:hypothetical protein
MTARWIKESRLAAKLSFRCRVSLAGAVLIAVAILFAIPVGTAAGAVGSVVPTVTETSAPSLPSATSPQIPVPAAPQVPVKVPTVPQVPAEASPAPQAPSVKVPKTTQSSPHLAPAPPGGSTKPSGPGVDLPSVNEIASHTKGSAGTATGAPAVGVQQTAAAARNGVDSGSGSHSTRGPGIEAGSVESAKVAPLQRLLAYVWPAIALGPAWNLLMTLQPPWEAVTSLEISDVPRLLAELAKAIGAGGVAGISEHSATSNLSPADSTGIWVPDGGEISLFLFIVLCAALVALVVFTVRRELRSMHRWPL